MRRFVYRGGFLSQNNFQQTLHSSPLSTMNRVTSKFRLCSMLPMFCGIQYLVIYLEYHTGTGLCRCNIRNIVISYSHKMRLFQIWNSRSTIDSVRVRPRERRGASCTGHWTACSTFLGLITKQSPEFYITALCAGNPPGTSGFPNKGAGVKNVFPCHDVIVNQQRLYGTNALNRVKTMQYNTYWFLTSIGMTGIVMPILNPWFNYKCSQKSGSNYASKTYYREHNTLLIISEAGNSALLKAPAGGSWNLYETVLISKSNKLFRKNIFLSIPLFDMMSSSNWNIFRVTGHLCGEFTGPRWIPRTKASDAEHWCFPWSAFE